MKKLRFGKNKMKRLAKQRKRDMTEIDRFGAAMAAVRKNHK